MIESDGGVSKAMAILKECELRLEDILPFFPSFVRIGEFKDQICKSLELYNGSIDALKEEMKEFAQSAELIRKDINELRNRNGVVNASSKCDLCSQLVLTRQFFLFPFPHVFHVDCMIKTVPTYLEKNPRLKAEIFSAKSKKDKEKKTLDKKTVTPTPPTHSHTASSLLPSLTGKDKDKDKDKEKSTVAAEEESKERRRKERVLENFAASQCLFCGDIMINSVQEPFIAADEDLEVGSWRIRQPTF